jgi:leucyl-tRNA synthetase
MHLNTAVAAVMELSNEMARFTDRPRLGAADAWAVREAFETLAKLLSPMAPHFAEEVWEQLGGTTLVAVSPWPEADPALLEEEHVTLVVQVDGKLRGQLRVPRGIPEQEALEAARRDRRVGPHLDGKTIRRVVYVPDRLLNLVTR